MFRNPLLRPVLAAVLVLALLLPSAAARGPAVSAPEWGISFWDLLLRFLPLKNGSQIDPDGLTGAAGGAENDNRGTIDPDGLTGTTGGAENDNRSQIDPNG